MTRIAIFLTAIPLAVALAMVLNTLLDRRLAAVTRTVRRPSRTTVRGVLALVASSSLAALPAAATEARETPPTECAAIECSLAADASRVESLWHRSPRGIVLVSQSPVPASDATIGEPEVLETGPMAVETDRSPEAAHIRAESAHTRP